MQAVLAENVVRAGQAAWWYSLRMPPSRCRRRMSRWVKAALSVAGGSGCSGRALAIFHDDADVIAKVSRGLGEAMVGINVDDIPEPHRLAERGW